MLKSRQEKKTLQNFLDWLLDPAFFPRIRRSQTQVELQRVRQEISRLEKLKGHYVRQAVSDLRKEERLLASDTAYRTYESLFMSRKAPKNLGNIEETERLFVAACIARKLHPKVNPYMFLKERLARRGDHRTLLAIQMRVSRFERRLQKDEAFSCEQILEQHYLRFKGYRMWRSPFGHHLAATLEQGADPNIEARMFRAMVARV